MAGKIIKGFFGFILVMMGLMGAFGQRMVEPHMAEFEARQQIIDAKIIALNEAERIRRPSHARGRAARGGYLLANAAAKPTGTYEFTAPDGKTYRDDFSIAKENFGSFRIGGTVRIWYIPDNPNLSGLVTKVDGLPEETPPHIAYTVSFGFFAWGAWLLYRATDGVDGQAKPKASPVSDRIARMTR